MNVYVLTVDIYEPEGAGLDYPVVRHQFLGRTKKEAEGYFDSHLRTDSFLRDCVEKKRFGKIRCQIGAHWGTETAPI